MTEWNDIVRPDLIGKTVEVLDKGSVQLVDLMPHPSADIAPDLAIVNAARVSFLGDSKGYEKDKKLIDYLVRNGHTTPLEMVEFKFRVHAPVMTWWQWVRHRTWNFNAQSGRYTPFEEDQFYIPEPDAWRKQSKSNKQGSSDNVFTREEAQIIIQEQIAQVAQGLDIATEYSGLDFNDDIGLSYLLKSYIDTGFQIYQALLDNGAAKEQARLFLPGWSSYYTWIAKIDLHNLLHFLKLRMDSHAQYEIRVYANAIYEHFVKPAVPVVSEAFEKHILNGG